MPLLEGAHALDLDRALEGPALDRGRDVVELDLEQVGEHPHHRRPHHLQRAVVQHHREDVHGPAEADDVADHVGRVVEGVVEQLLHAQLGDAGADAAEQGGEDVEGPARVDAGDEHRRAARLAGRFDEVEQLPGRSAGAAAGRTRSTPRCARRGGSARGRGRPPAGGCRRWRCRRRSRRRRRGPARRRRWPSRRAGPMPASSPASRPPWPGSPRPPRPARDRGGRRRP